MTSEQLAALLLTIADLRIIIDKQTEQIAELKKKLGEHG